MAEINEFESQTSEVAIEGGDEDSLDNFFKKKDKKGKKKKTKKSDKGTEKEGLKAKKKESESKKDNKEQKDENAAEDPEEWIDFEDESERDYSDLKIQNLQINNDQQEKNQVEVPEYDETGELIPPKPAEGPWRKVDAGPEPQQVREEPKTVVAEPPKKLGAYRPPQLRSGAAGSNLAPSSLPRRTRKQQAPEINSEMDFPSLAAATNDTATPQGFEVVKSGSKSGSWKSQNQKNRSEDIKLGNQFSALNMGR